jgi:hypothetical protein
LLAQDCRLALVLAVDVSSSVDAAEDRLQREGIARALVAGPVVRAFLAGDPVEVYAFEWSGQRSHVALTRGWERVEGYGDLRRIAEAIAASPRSRSNLPTAVGAALGHAANMLRDGPECRARTVDVAGDGIHNEGFTPAQAYAAFPFGGVTVNALIVGGAQGNETDAELVAWFQAEVLRGPGAFSIYADGYEDYARAMEAKLLRELAPPMVGAAGQAPPRLRSVDVADLVGPVALHPLEGMGDASIVSGSRIWRWISPRHGWRRGGPRCRAACGPCRSGARGRSGGRSRSLVVHVAHLDQLLEVVADIGALVVAADFSSPAVTSWSPMLKRRSAWTGFTSRMFSRSNSSLMTSRRRRWRRSTSVSVSR